ncbi:MAG: 23S rRNA (pseudouridine(1915)-N(3))-methyltransferase RlmH [Erysipelotrichaceae bacterium]
MIKLLVVGKINGKALRELIDDYLKRIQPYHKINIEEVADEATSEDVSQQKSGRIKEGERILGRLKPDDTVILLDLQGDEFDSLAFAKILDEQFTYSSSTLVFVIGGSMGVSDEVQNRADRRWKLSSVTFPHQIVRLLVLEQIYRAFKINRNQTYHK